MGPGLSTKVLASRRAHADEYSSVGTWCPCPRISCSCPLACHSPRDPQGAGSYGQVMKALLSLVPLCVRPWTCPQEWSLCFPVLWVPALKPHCPLKPNTLGAHSSLCQAPRLGNLTWAPELSFLWENFNGINCSLVCRLLMILREGVWDLIILQVPCPYHVTVVCCLCLWI